MPDLTSLEALRLAATIATRQYLRAVGADYVADQSRGIIEQVVLEALHTEEWAELRADMEATGASRQDVLDAIWAGIEDAGRVLN
jgi:hypothetical protein